MEISYESELFAVGEEEPVAASISTGSFWPCLIYEQALC